MGHEVKCSRGANGYKEGKGKETQEEKKNNYKKKDSSINPTRTK